MNKNLSTASFNLNFTGCYKKKECTGKEPTEQQLLKKNIEKVVLHQDFNLRQFSHFLF